MGASDMNAPTSNLPWAEQYRLAAKAWVELDKAANMLEETKSAVLSQRMKAQGDMAVSKAELIVKASPEWEDYVRSTVEARAQANLKKVHLEYIRMKFMEWNNENANRRAEARL